MADEQVADAPVETGEATSVEVSWHDALPEDVRDHPSLATFTDTGALAKSFVHAQSIVGADKIPVPGKWADDNDWNTVYDKLGRPADGDAYELDFGNVPEGQDVQEDFVKWFRGTAHKHGLNNRQAQSLAKEYVEFATNMQQETTIDPEAHRAQVTADMKKELGRAYDERIQRGNQFIDDFAEAELTHLVLQDGTALRDNPAFIRTLIKAQTWIQDNIGEDRIVQNRDTNARTPDEAQARVNELMRSDSPYWDRTHSQHRNIVDEVQLLMQEIHPNEEGEAA